jgi:hypothetical protein
VCMKIPFARNYYTTLLIFIVNQEEKASQPYKGESEDAFLRRQLLTSWYLQRVKYLLSAYLQTRLRKACSRP